LEGCCVDRLSGHRYPGTYADFFCFAPYCCLTRTRHRLSCHSRLLPTSPGGVDGSSIRPYVSVRLFKYTSKLRRGGSRGSFGQCQPGCPVVPNLAVQLFFEVTAKNAAASC